MLAAMIKVGNVSALTFLWAIILSVLASHHSYCRLLAICAFTGAPGAMREDLAACEDGVRASTGEATTCSASNSVEAEARAKRASIAAAKLKVVAHEDLCEDEAASLLLQPRSNPLQIANRCMSKIPAVIRLVLSRCSGSDLNFFFAAQATSRIVASYPHILPQLLRFFRTSKSLLLLLEDAPSLSSSDALNGGFCVLNVLETALRFYELAPDTVLRMWEWTPVTRVLDSKMEEERALGVRILSMILHLSEQETSQLAKSVVKAAITGGNAGADCLADAYNSRDEMERREHLASLFAHDVAPERVQPAIKGWRQSHKSAASSVDLGGVLLEREQEDCNDGAAASHSSIGGADEARAHSGDCDQFVFTETVQGNLARLGAALCRDAAILVGGPSASGKTAVVMHAARKLGKDKGLIRIHLDDQMDSKTLLGSYVCTDTPGEFLWKAGALTQAVLQGRWVLIEDIDLAPFEILSALIPLLESGELYIASRNVSVKAREGFRLFGTRTSGQAGRRESAGLPMLQALTTQVAVEVWSHDEVAEVVGVLHPKLRDFNLVPMIAQLHALICGGGSEAYPTVAGVRFRRVLTMRDVLKLCRRLGSMLPAVGVGGSGYLTDALREAILREGMDCLCNMLPDPADRAAVAGRLAGMLDVSHERVEYMLSRHKPEVKLQAGTLQVGRIYLDELDGSRVAAKLHGRKGAQERAVFCGTVHALQTLEAVAAAIHHREPVLLTGETGTGKTSLVQHLASLVGAEMVVVNLNQQSDAGDLLGGFKPVEVRQLAQELMDDLMELLPKVISKSKNTAFLQSCRDKFEAQKWKQLTKLMAQATALVESLIAGKNCDGAMGTQNNGDVAAKGGKRKSSDDAGAEKQGKSGRSISPQVRRLWRSFSLKVSEFGRKVDAVAGKFAFAFVEGVLVKALREGHWLLLDEVNLAPAETLQRLSGLLDGDSGSVALTERGDIDVVQRHPNFRLFACMNPATDVGKKDLPVSLRARFTEMFVDELEDESELREVVQSYLRGVSKNQHVVDIVSFYLAARALARKGDLFDGANQKVHFNLRSLTRTLQYVNFMQMQGYTFERALFEGACMVFATQLHPVCQPLMDKAIMQHLCRTASTAGNTKPNLSNPDEYVCMGQYTHGKTEFTGFYLKKGQGYGKIQIPTFILTPACQLNLRNIVRAAAPHRYPILLQGPTSAGKTSMIEYLAACAGHAWVRINNHAHTDVQEYLGAYASDRFGRLVFCEGPLVKALRCGHWLVLDELNLAPSEVLEMLNRLLDDNRELLIPETQEIVKPHPHFMLFATQNPAGGAYGGRKIMSRAFRNRFLEVHVDDIPVSFVGTREA